MRDSFDATAAPHEDAATTYMRESFPILRKMSLKGILWDDGLDYIDLVGRLYNQEERDLIRSLGERFPRIKLGFSFFGLLRPVQRPFEALKVSEMQPRSGWLRIGVPDGWAQSIDDHHNSCVKLAKLVFHADPELDEICNALKYHDIGEPVISDFTPHCTITKAEKTAIEELGVRLITASAKDGNCIAGAMKRSFDLYEGLIPGYDTVRKKARDIDLLEMILELPMIRHKCPIEERGKIDRGAKEFEEYVGSRLTSPRTKAFYDGIVNAPDRHAHPTEVWKHGCWTMNLTA